MIPTLDFSNIVRKIVQAAGATFLNPVAWSVAFAVATGVALISVASSFNGMLFGVGFDPTVYIPENEYLQFFGYVFCLDVPVSLISTLLGNIGNIVLFVPVVLVSFFSAMFVFRKMSVIRKAWEGLTK